MELGKNVIMFFSIVIELKCSMYSYTMNKIEPCNDQFCPYTLDFDFFFNGSKIRTFFDTSSFLHIKEEPNITYQDIEYITIKNELKTGESHEQYYGGAKNLKYINTISKDNNLSASIGIGMNDKYFSRPKDYYNNSYFEYLEFNKVEKYISFIQKDSKTAEISFGGISEEFQYDTSPTCGCDKMNITNTNHVYWCCEITSIKVGGEKISYSITKLYGIFSISEEYIIAPKNSGEEVLNYYKKKIHKDYGEDTCSIMEDNDTKIMELNCNYFNYETLPNLYIMFNNTIAVMALSSDLFKVDEKDDKTKLIFKLKVNSNETDLNWYLGEPIIKNYNLLLNYTDQKNIKISIMPTSLNGFLLIIIAVLGGFLFLIIFLGMLYYLAKKEKVEKEMEKYNDIIKDTDDIENSNTFKNTKKKKTSKEMNEIFSNFTSPTNLITEKLDDVNENYKHSNNNNNNRDIKKGNKYNIESSLKKENNHRNNDINQDNSISPQNIEFCMNDYGVEIDEDNDDDFFIKIKKK